MTEETTLTTQKEAAPPALPQVAYNMDPTIRTRGYELVGSANKAICENEEQRGMCISLDDMLKGQLQASNEYRKEITTPMDQAKSVIMDRFNAEKKAMEQARARVQKLIIEFTTRLENEARAAADEAKAKHEEEAQAEASRLEEEGRHEEAEEKLQEGIDLSDSVGPAIQTGPARGVVGGTASIKDVWQFEIEDADKVPRGYCTPNDTLIRQAIRRSNSPVREIPGVKIYPEKKMANR